MISSLRRTASVAVLTALATAALLPAVASAQEMLNFNVGAWEAFQSENREGMAGFEYRGNYFWHNLRPNAGLFVTTDGAQYYYGGFGYDFFLDNSHNFVLTPNLAVGIYNHSGGESLGGPIEFKSGIEAAYIFPNQQRLGLALHHLSNASIYDHNPGSETVTVQYSIPFTVFGQ